MIVEIWAPDERIRFEANRQLDKRVAPSVEAKWHGKRVEFLGACDDYAAFKDESMGRYEYELIHPKFLRKAYDA